MKDMSWRKPPLKGCWSKRIPRGRQKDWQERGILKNLGFGLRQIWLKSHLACMSPGSLDKRFCASLSTSAAWPCGSYDWKTPWAITTRKLGWGKGLLFTGPGKHMIVRSQVQQRDITWAGVLLWLGWGHRAKVLWAHCLLVNLKHKGKNLKWGKGKI